MSRDSERIKTLLEFKKKLEKKIENLKSELIEAQTILDTINAILLEKGFERAQLPKPTIAKTETSPSREEAVKTLTKYEATIPLKSVNDELLANLYIDNGCLRVVMAEDKKFQVNTPPFTNFLVERVLTKMQEKDEELARTGQLTPDKIFSYKIVRDGDVIREIQIKNVDKERIRELKSSIRWTLEKMYEKMRA